MDEKLYTMTETCAQLGIKRRTLCRFLESGAVAHYRPSGRAGRGSKVMFSRKHLDDFLKQVEQKSVYDHVQEMVRLIGELREQLAAAVGEKK